MEQPGGLGGGGINNDRGGDGDGDVDAMARHQKRVVYEEENTLRPFDGGSVAHLLLAL